MLIHKPATIPVHIDNAGIANKFNSDEIIITKKNNIAQRLNINFIINNVISL